MMCSVCFVDTTMILLESGCGFLGGSGIRKYDCLWINSAIDTPDPTSRKQGSKAPGGAAGRLPSAPSPITQASC